MSLVCSVRELRALCSCSGCEDRGLLEEMAIYPVSRILNKKDRFIFSTKYYDDDKYAIDSRVKDILLFSLLIAENCRLI